MKIVVISPTYNEKTNIQKLIPLLEEEVFPKVSNHDLHLLIVDDNSPDGTGEIVADFKKKYKNIELLKGQKEGLGAAYIRGMNYAINEMKADVVVEFDADFQHDPHDIPRLIGGMDDGYDYVIGSRYIKGGAIPKEWEFDRKVKSILGSFIARVILFTFAIHDMTSGFKLTKTKYLKQVDLDNLFSRNFAYKMQILYEVVRLGAKVKEVPIVFYERTRGKSKMDTNDLYESLGVIFRLRYRDSQRFIRFFIVGCSGFIIQIVAQELSIATGVSLLIAQGLSNIIDIFINHTDVLSLSHAVAAGLGAEIAIVCNFMFNNFWTFNDARSHGKSTSFIGRLLKFNVTSIGAVIIQFITVWIGEKVFGPNLSLFILTIPTRIAIVIPTIIVLIIPLNYVIYNKIIWKTQHIKES